MSAIDLIEASEADWAIAKARLAVIRGLAATPLRTRADVAQAAREIGCGVTYAYILLARYLADPRLTTLLPQRRGRKAGRSMLSVELDQIIQTATEEVYLTRQQAQVSDLVTEVQRRCRAASLPAPSRGAIERRLKARPAAQVVARRHGRKAARDRYSPAVGSLEAPHPLALVQIDHTKVDVIVVDSVTREPIQRPWLSLAIDVATRCVAGFHLSLEPPSATSVALTIAHAALPKDARLAEHGVAAAWPVRGIPERLHLDNAKEFRSEALRRGCEQYGIAIDYRPVRTPHYGGHIERLIGTMMGKVHLLPGTTFSNTREKGDLTPDKTAAMTLDEVERWLTHAIAGVYHQDLHRGIGTTPLEAWRRGIAGDETMLGRGEPTPVTDPRRFLIDFLPIARRLVRRDGVALHSIGYWADVLSTWVGHPDPMIVRYDPRDLSRIYLQGPDGAYYDLSYRDLRRPPISLWEHRLALNRLRQDGRAQVDEAEIFRAIDAMRAIADGAVLASKTARRQRERRLRLALGGRSEDLSAMNAPELVTVEAATEEVAIFPFEDWS
ncbi:MAG: DDE-type integrase/transposase/recombinase [Devosia sp.]|nr:DDE-type integrase/transposase/recombinase [Devosia sp.]